MQRLRLQLYDLNYGAIQIILLTYLLNYLYAQKILLKYIHKITEKNLNYIKN